MNYLRPLLVAFCSGTFAVLVFAGPVRARDTHMTQKGMGHILSSYLQIQGALAADSTDGVHAAAKSIATDAAMLDAEGVRGKHAAHTKDLPAALRGAAEALRDAPGLEAAREAFKQLSKPMIKWATMAKPAGIDTLFCEMANAGWLQRRGEVRNPYYGKSMLTCGEVVSGAGDSMGAMPHDHGGKH